MIAKQSLSKSDIKKVCDILRRDDGVGAKNYVEQLSWLLFLKVFENVEGELKELAEAEGKKYQAIIDSEYQWSTWAKKDWKDKDELVYFVNQKLFPYLKNLKGSKEKDKISEVFRELSGNLIRSAHNLLDIIDILDQIEMRHFQDTHLLSQVYEEILQEMGSEGGWAGEFYTPRPIIRLMIKMVNPKIGETIFDPFVGSGGFLVESFDYIQEQSKNIGVKEWDTLQNKTFSGQEKTPLPYLIGTMNMMLHRILVPNLTRSNTFMEDIHNLPDGSKKEIILTNPPFGGKEHLSVQNNFPIPVGATEGLALQYVMKRLKTGGRCGIVLPEGQILFGSGAFQKIRQELLEKFNVHSIISLPVGAFAQMGAGVKTNLIFFDKTGSTKEIWYGEVSGKFTKKQKMHDSDFEEVFTKWQKREVSETSWIASIDEIKERGYDLSPKNPNNKNTDIEMGLQEILDKIEERQKIISEKQQLLRKNIEIFFKDYSKNWKKFKVGDVCEVFSGSSAPQLKKHFDENGKLFVRVSDLGVLGITRKLNSSRDRVNDLAIKEKKLVLAKKGTILFPKSGAAILGNNRALLDVDAYIVGHLAALYPKENVDSTFVFYMFQNIDMKKYIPNVAYPSLNLSVIRDVDILLPVKNGLPDLEEQKRIASLLDIIQEQAGFLRKENKEQLNVFNILNKKILKETFQG